MKKLIYYFQQKNITVYFLKCFLFLSIVLCIQSCNKKKQVHLKNTHNTAEIYRLIKKADSLNKSLQDDSSIYYFRKAEQLCNPKIDYANQYVYIISQIGYILQRTGDYYESETVLTKALPYIKYTVKKPRLGQMVYTYTAYNYYNNYDYDNALLYHKKALEISISKFRKAQITSDIAFIYMHQKKYKEAINLLEPLAKKKIIDQTDAVNTEVQYAAILYNLGLSYLRLGNHQKLAFDNLNKSLEITLKTNNYFELIGAYHALYLYYRKYPNAELKKFHALNAYISACKANSVSNQINSLTEVIEAEDGKDLRKYINLYIKLTDSTYAKQEMAENQFANIKYDSKKDKEENLELKNQKAEKELQIQIQKNRSSILYIIIGIVALVSLSLTYYLTSKSKKEKNEAVLKSEMHISDKLHNELTNEIHDILTFAGNHDLENIENKEKFLSSLNNIYAKTRNISRENSEITTDRRYVDNLKNMISGFKTSYVNILINGLNDINWIKIDKHKKIVIYRVVQEVFLNMKKHSDATLAGISFKITERELTINYTDNGKGISIDEITKSGLSIVQNRISNIKGEAYFDSIQDQGLKISFKIPV